MNDPIERQAAIDALGERPLAWTESEYETGLQNQWEADVDAIKAVPPAQPEQDCVLKQFGECSYDVTGCSDCKIKVKIKTALSAQPEPCDLCSNLEKEDTLYQSSDWDGGIGFDYIRDIQFCPKCGRRLEAWKEGEEAE